MSKQNFYVCRHCGNIIAYDKASGVQVSCCGEKMQQLIPNTVDASNEKHIPIIATEGNKVTVTVGSVLHPMADEHHIAWISLESKSGNQRKELKPNDKPEAVFSLTEGDEPIAAYAFCNLHGLWRKEKE